MTLLCALGVLVNLLSCMWRVVMLGRVPRSGDTHWGAGGLPTEQGAQVQGRREGAHWLLIADRVAGNRELLKPGAG